MIEKKLKTTNGKVLVSIPTQLNEVTLGQMIDLQEAEALDDIKAISILSGVPVTDLQSVTDATDFTQFADAIYSLSMQIKYLYSSDVIPDKISVPLAEKLVLVAVSKNLGVEPAGAFMAARDVIAEEIEKHIKSNGEDNWQENFNPSLLACCKVLAQYLYCRVTGLPYDEYAVTAFIDTIKKLRVTEALPIAKHFFQSFPNLSRRKTGFWHRLLQLWKSVLALTASKSLSTSTR